MKAECTTYQVSIRQWTCPALWTLLDLWICRIRQGRWTCLTHRTHQLVKSSIISNRCSNQLNKTSNSDSWSISQTIWSEMQSLMATHRTEEQTIWLITKAATITTSNRKSLPSKTGTISCMKDESSTNAKPIASTHNTTKASHLRRTKQRPTRLRIRPKTLRTQLATMEVMPPGTAQIILVISRNLAHSGRRMRRRSYSTLFSM